MKQYINSAFVYAILAMIGGVFYREFTKFNAFSDQTTLGMIHTHYFVLGMVVFLILLLLERSFSFSNNKTKYVLAAYHAGLNITAITFMVRGILQVQGAALSSSVGSMISGVAGIGHMLLAVGLIALLVQIKRGVKVSAEASVP